MADEYSKPPHNRTMPIPKTYTWETLTNKSGDELEVHYNNLLRELVLQSLNIRINLVDMSIEKV